MVQGCQKNLFPGVDLFLLKYDLFLVIFPDGFIECVVTGFFLLKKTAVIQRQTFLSIFFKFLPKSARFFLTII